MLAIMPGRCAAPPAPATITFSPRARAVFAYSTMRSGVRWAETICASKGTSSAFSASAACFMVGQSDWLPMMMPTRARPELEDFAMLSADFCRRRPPPPALESEGV